MNLELITVIYPAAKPFKYIIPLPVAMLSLILYILILFASI
jgi:hypothetical protein